MVATERANRWYFMIFCYNLCKRGMYYQWSGSKLQKSMVVYLLYLYFSWYFGCCEQPLTIVHPEVIREAEIAWHCPSAVGASCFCDSKRLYIGVCLNMGFVYPRMAIFAGNNMMNQWSSGYPLFRQSQPHNSIRFKWLCPSILRQERWQFNQSCGCMWNSEGWWFLMISTWNSPRTELGTTRFWTSLNADQSQLRCTCHQERHLKTCARVHCNLGGASDPNSPSNLTSTAKHMFFFSGKLTQRSLLNYRIYRAMSGTKIQVPAWRTGRLCGGLHVCAQWNPGGVDIDILEILGKEQRCWSMGIPIYCLGWWWWWWSWWWWSK